MAPPRLTPEDLQKVRDLAAQWGTIVARRALGDDGPGLDVGLAAMEEVAAAAARGLTEGTLAHLLEQHAERLGAEQPCPGCGQPCPVRRDPRPLVMGDGTTVVQKEPACHCPACRRDFFPPTTAAGSG
jgi:hypothetical protein